MKIFNHQKRREDARTLPKLPQNECHPERSRGIPLRYVSMMLRDSSTPLRSARNDVLEQLMRFVLASLFLCAIPVYAADAPFNSASISGLGARNIGSAAMSGRISSIAGVHEPSGKITLFVGAASGGVWKTDDSGTRYRPIFDEQAVQSIGAIALDPKNSKNVWVGTGESWTRNTVSIGDGIYKSTDGGETSRALLGEIGTHLTDYGDPRTATLCLPQFPRVVERFARPRLYKHHGARRAASPSERATSAQRR